MIVTGGGARRRCGPLVLMAGPGTADPPTYATPSLAYIIPTARLLLKFSYINKSCLSGCSSYNVLQMWLELDYTWAVLKALNLLWHTNERCNSYKSAKLHSIRYVFSCLAVTDAVWYLFDSNDMIWNLTDLMIELPDLREDGIGNHTLSGSLTSDLPHTWPAAWHNYCLKVIADGPVTSKEMQRNFTSHWGGLKI